MVRISEEQYRLLQRLCKQTGVTSTTEASRMLARWVEQNDVEFVFPGPKEEKKKYRGFELRI